MKAVARHEGELCDRFHEAVELIGKRWTGAIIFMLLAAPRRFAALRDGIPAMTDKMLSDRLRELEREGIVDRKVFAETPVRIEYSLTEKGRGLAKAFEALTEWADEWLAPPGARLAAHGKQARPRPGVRGKK